MAEVTLCSEFVNRGSGRWINFQPCGRKAVEDGLCKIHLRARNRQREKNDALTEKFRRMRRLEQEAKQLGRKLGIKVEPEYPFVSSDYTGRLR